MNAVNTIGQTMAMDGRSYYNSAATKAAPVANTGSITKSSAEVAQNIVQNLAEVQASVDQLQKLSDISMGHKVQFNVNDELGKVIIKVVDPKTDQVIKEIPSEDIQKMQARINKVLGLLFDEMI